MKFTTQEIRGAILRAADRIERNPEFYDFRKTQQPTDCGTPACMFGWIAFELGSPLEMHGHRMLVHRFAQFIRTGGVSADWGYHFRELYDMCDGDHNDAKVAVAAMRAYADKYFPAEQVEESKQLVRWSDCIWQPKAVA